MEESNLVAFGALVWFGAKLLQSARSIRERRAYFIPDSPIPVYRTLFRINARLSDTICKV
jgi:hypothetical protein